MDTPYPKYVKTKMGSQVIIFGEINDQLFGAWNDGADEWYASQWFKDGRRFNEPEASTSLDLILN